MKCNETLFLPLVPFRTVQLKRSIADRNILSLSHAPGQPDIRQTVRQCTEDPRTGEIRQPENITY